MACAFLPPATKLRQGYVFTRACDSVHRGGGIPACIAGGIPACLAGLHAHTQGGSWGVWPRGVFRSTWGVLRPTPEGALQAQTPGVSQHTLRQTLPPTATAAGLTHPTGMHSCYPKQNSPFNPHLPCPWRIPEIHRGLHKYLCRCQWECYCQVLCC